MPQSSSNLSSESEKRTDAALERTVLAIERTLLSYWRTGLAFGAAGALVVKLFVSPFADILGGVLVVFGCALFFYGTRKCILLRRGLQKDLANRDRE